VFNNVPKVVVVRTPQNKIEEYEVKGKNERIIAKNSGRKVSMV
jgi:hypothetical protein